MGRKVLPKKKKFVEFLFVLLRTTPWYSSSGTQPLSSTHNTGTWPGTPVSGRKTVSKEGRVNKSEPVDSGMVVYGELWSGLDSGISPIGSTIYWRQLPSFPPKVPASPRYIRSSPPTDLFDQSKGLQGERDCYRDGCLRGVLRRWEGDPRGEHLLGIP